MNDTLLYGLDVIAAVQQLRTLTADTVFRGITLLGQEEFYLLVLPLILWCVDFRIGVRLSFVVLLSHYVNVCVKDFIAEPRPFVFRPEVQLFPVDGYSLPSNHAQTGLVFWLGLARLAQKRYLWLIGGGLTILIGFSRIYLGVHFPTDVLAGWGLGGILLISFIAAEPLLVGWTVRLKPRYQGLLAIVGPILLFGAHPTKESASVVAALSGAGVGLILAQQYFVPAGLAPLGKLVKLFTRAFVGLTGLVLIWAGLKMVFVQENNDYFLHFRYIRYWLAGIWLTLGAPWLFNLIGLVPGITGTESGKKILDNTKTMR
ncbi:MAG: superfamily protein [Sporomusa sp.]|nr:superfamily protein [Sporomusa sp.]